MAFNGNQYIWKDRKRFMGMPLSFTRYAMSEDRLFLSIGFLSVSDDELLLYRVRDISVKRTLWQRIFGVGSVIISSSDKSTPVITLKNIKSPMLVKELLHENVEDAKLKRRMRFSEMMTDMDTYSDEDLEAEGDDEA